MANSVSHQPAPAHAASRQNRLQPVGYRAPAAAATPSLLAAAAMAPAGLFGSTFTASLQRTLGNRAVQRLVTANRLVVQREPIVLDITRDDAEEDAGDWSDLEIELWMQSYRLVVAKEKPKYEASLNALRRLQEERAADRQTFAELGAAAAQKVRRDQGRITTAIQLVRQWILTSQLPDHPDPAFRGVKDNEPDIGDRLIAIVNDPFKLNQEDYPICGANAFLHSIAVRQPDDWVKYVLGLIQTGKGNIGALQVESPESVSEKDLASKDRGRDINIGDWVAMASLRASQNSAFKVRRMGKRFAKDQPGLKGAAKKGGLYPALAGIGGMSRIPEVNAWFTKAGYTEVQSTDNTLRAYLFGSSAADVAKLQGLGGKFGAKEIILLVSMNQIKADPANRPEGRGDHFVRLASGVATSGDYLLFRVWTWGEVHDLKVKKLDVGKVVYGWVEATPPPPQLADEGDGDAEEPAPAAAQAEPGGPEQAEVVA